MPKARKSRSNNRYQPYIDAAIRAGIKAVTNRVTSGTWTGTGKTRNGPSSSGVTSNYDKSVQYKRKTAPRKIRRKYKRIYNQNKWALIKKLGTNVFVRNHTISGSWLAGWTTANSQRVVNCCIYGLNGAAPGTDSAGYSDINSIAANDERFADDFQSLFFSSAVLDITFRNTGTAFALEVDMYEIIFKGRTSGNDLITDYNQALINTPEVIPGTGTNPITTLQLRGITPFDCSLASSKGYRVLKKTKYFVPAGQTFTFQHRDPRNHFLSNHYFTSGTGGQWNWKTYNLLFVAKPVAGTDTALLGTFVVGVTRTYHYKILQDNQASGSIIQT